MKKEQSFGIIPLRLKPSGWEVLLIQHQAGHWAFPKGHPEEKETPRQTAERELFEETGLIVKHFLLPDPLIENYIFHFHHQLISKSVSYFLAVVEGDVVIQEKEIQASRWLTFPDAFEQMTYAEGKSLCLQVIEFLKGLDEAGNPFLAT